MDLPLVPLPSVNPLDQYHLRHHRDYFTKHTSPDKPMRKSADGDRLAKKDAAIDTRDLPDESLGPRLQRLDQLGDPARGGALRGRYLPGHLDLPSSLTTIRCLHRLAVPVARLHDDLQPHLDLPFRFPDGKRYGKVRAVHLPGWELTAKLVQYSVKL